VTSQARDFDADLDFDRFGMTGFFEAVTFSTAFRISSSFSGCREMGFDLSGVDRFGMCSDLLLLFLLLYELYAK
jgi:hypothetical protein